MARFVEARAFDPGMCMGDSRICVVNQTPGVPGNVVADIRSVVVPGMACIMHVSLLHSSLSWNTLAPVDVIARAVNKHGVAFYSLVSRSEWV